METSLNTSPTGEIGKELQNEKLRRKISETNRGEKRRSTETGRKESVLMRTELLRARRGVGGAGQDGAAGRVAAKTEHNQVDVERLGNSGLAWK